MFFTTEDLVSSVKRTGFIPTGQSTFTDPDDFIAFANEEIHLKLVPHIAKVRQNFFAKYSTIPLVDSLNHYSVPERAVGNNLLDVFYLPSLSDLSNKRPLKVTPIHDQQMYQASSSAEVFTIMMVGDEIITIPTPKNPSGYLMCYYLRKPSTLVPSTSCAKITGIASSGGTTTFTVNTDLTSSLSVGSTLDTVNGRSPFFARYMDVPITAITSSTIQVATSNVQNEGSIVDVVVGDYLCPAQQTNIPQVPDLFHPVLGKMVVARCLFALGHMDKLNMVKAEIVDNLRDAWSLIENRIEAEVDTMYDQNGLVNMVNNWFTYNNFIK